MSKLNAIGAAALESQQRLLDEKRNSPKEKRLHVVMSEREHDEYKDLARAARMTLQEYFWAMHKGPGYVPDFKK